MKEFFKELIDTITIENILSKPEVDSNFRFNKAGWYFFISPISGILKIKISRSIIDDTTTERYLKYRLLIVIGCENQSDYFDMYNFAVENLNIFNELQKKLIHVVGKHKIHITNPGVYKLKLLSETTSYTNTNPYYRFNGIDSHVFDFYLDRINSFTDFDHYLNHPFYFFMYDLDGLMIYKEYVDSPLKIGVIYECKIDYITRNSLLTKQLAIRKIYLPLKISLI